MNMVSIDPKNPQASVIAQAVRILRQGGVVAYPTDTAYGLACDALNEEAIGKIFIMKKRYQKPLPVAVANMKMAETVAIMSEQEKKIAKKYWPGPLSIIVQKKDSVPPALTLGLQTIGVRIPNHPVALALVSAFGKPITSTSANITGQGNCYNAECVHRNFRSEIAKPDLILDGGELPEVPVSTVIQVQAGKVHIVREGPVKVGF